MRLIFWLGISIATCAGCANSGNGELNQELFERIDVDVGTQTNTILAANLNDDNHLDLLVVGSDQVISLQGEGDGNFDVVNSIAAGENAVDLAISDIDEDGINDLAIANHETNYVTLLFGVPGGGFEMRPNSHLEVNVSPHPHAVRLSDIDNDNHVDLLVDDRNAEAIKFFPGLGNGEFGNPSQIPVGGDPYRGMCLVDINKDDKTDLITPNPNYVSVLIGDGMGGFAQDTKLYPSFSPFSVTAADLNDDDLIDIAAASGEGVGKLAVWSESSKGGFSSSGEYELAVGPTKIAAADLTGDGKAEVVITNYIGREVAVLIAGDEPELYRFVIAGNPYGVATGDFNNDGRNDFAIANDGATFISVFLSINKETDAKTGDNLLNDPILYQNFPNPFNPILQSPGSKIGFYLATLPIPSRYSFFLRSSSSVSSFLGSGKQQSTGQTAAHCGSSWKPLHSVHLSGTI